MLTQMKPFLRTCFHPLSSQIVRFLEVMKPIVERRSDYHDLVDEIEGHIHYLKSQVELFENCKKTLRDQYDLEVQKLLENNAIMSEELTEIHKPQEVDF